MKETIPSGLKTMELEHLTYKGQITNIASLEATFLNLHSNMKDLEKDFNDHVEVPSYTTKEKVLQQIKEQIQI